MGTARAKNSISTRSPSTSSPSLSNIDVASPDVPADCSTHARLSAPSQPISSAGAGSTGSGMHSSTVDTVAEAPSDGVGRSRRARTNVDYSLKAMPDTKSTDNLTESGSRNVSGLTGRTLVDGEEAAEQPKKVDENMAEDEPGFPDNLPPRVHRRPSVRDRVKKVAESLGSALGKRRRDAGKTTASHAAGRGKTSKALKELDTGTKGVLDEMNFDDDDEPSRSARPSKKPKKEGKTSIHEIASKVAPVAASTSSGVPARKGKKWQAEGLYVGQAPAHHAKQASRKKLQKRPQESTSSDASAEAPELNDPRTPFLGLPMFDYLSKTKDFVIPYDVFAPSFRKGDPKPRDWHQLNRNRLVGEAKDLWEKEAPLARSLCICQAPRPDEQGCDFDCLNRAMHYECDSNNCGLDSTQCSNRAFTSLAKRMKKGGAFYVGVEVIGTAKRGFGVRACRTFAPGDIIMEYTGEIISEAECQRRMREVYFGQQCYYMMEFDKGLVIDGTKGSMARFVNHSCEPNCEVRMVNVGGTPRMGVFAGEGGVFTGEELTYDYNFDNFGETRQTCYCGAPSCRGYLTRRLNATEQKQRDREERERKKEAETEARLNAAEAERRKEVRNSRGSGWRGWVAVGDIKDQLKREKAAREEVEKSSARAKRLASRRHSLPSRSDSDARSERQNSTRRKTIIRPATKPSSVDSKTPGRALKDVVREKAASARKRPPPHRRNFSVTSETGISKFTEDLPSTSSAPAADGLCDAHVVGPPTSSHGSRTILKETAVSVTASLRQEFSVQPDVVAADGSHPRARKRSVEHDAAGGAEDDGDSEPPAKRRKPVSSSLDPAAPTKIRGLDVLRGVGQAVKHSLQHGKAKVMRQSTLAFARMD